MAGPQVAEADIAVAGKTNRILTFDLLRGLFLVVILIDHIELYPNFFSLFTGEGRMYVSVAEGFFFLSGLLVGMVYKRRLHLGIKFITKKMWTRAFELYIASVVLTLLFSFWAVAANHQGIKYGLPAVINWPHIISQTLQMRYQYGWADFLYRFVILMLMAPLVFWLVAKGKWWLVVIGSLTAWHFRGNNFVLAWQIIFNLGILAGFYWHQLQGRVAGLKTRPQKYLVSTVVAAAMVTFAISYASVYLLTLLDRLWGDGILPVWLQHFTDWWNHANDYIWVYAQKWTMGPLRIVLFLLWFPALYMLFERYQRPIQRYSRGMLELLGRNSLFVYTAHAFIVFGFLFYVPAHTSALQKSLITLAALVTLILVTVIYKVITTNPRPTNLDEAKHLVKKGRAMLSGNTSY